MKEWEPKLGRKKTRFQWDSSEEENAVEELPSRRKLKDLDNEYKKIVKRLLVLRPEDLSEIPMSDDLRDAIHEARKLKARKNVKGGLRRQVMRVATLLRQDDLDAVRTALERRGG